MSLPARTFRVQPMAQYNTVQTLKIIKNNVLQPPDGAGLKMGHAALVVTVKLNPNGVCFMTAFNIGVLLFASQRNSTDAPPLMTVLIGVMRNRTPVFGSFTLSAVYDLDVTL